MRATCLTTESQLWPNVLSNMPHDVYHLPEYAAHSARQDGGTPFACLVEDGGNTFFLPYLLRPLPQGPRESFDVVSPYGYPGPLICLRSPINAEDFISGAISAVIQNLRGQGAVSAFIRFSPVLPVPLEQFRKNGTLVCRGETVAVDLALSEQELWRQTRSGHRNNINKAKRLGHFAYIDEEWQDLDAFIDIYEQTMSRVSASSFYRFPRGYFDELQASLGNRLHLCIARIDGTVAAGGLFTEVGGIVQYHLSGTAGDFLKHQPSKLIIDFVRTWAKARGNRLLHLGGGVGGERDSLFDFKAGFSNLLLPFYTWRVVLDENVYARLTASWESQAGMQADDPDGFFPAYRKPL